MLLAVLNRPLGDKVEESQFALRKQLLFLQLAWKARRLGALQRGEVMLGGVDRLLPPALQVGIAPQNHADGNADGAADAERQAELRRIVQTLTRLEHAFKRWPWEDASRTRSKSGTPQHWDVQNEYHVQALVWAILAPTVLDLTDEEYLPKVGSMQPRPDLYSKKLKTAIEIKFIRDGTQAEFRKKTEEIASDSATYRADRDRCAWCIALIWDDSRSNDQHETMLSGLRQLEGVFDAVIVSRPGGWNRLPAPAGVGEVGQ